MDSVGDWLYILFLVVAGISGLFSSKEKKKRQSRPDILGQPGREIIPSDEPPAAPGKEKGFWELLEEIKREAAPKPPKRQPKPAADPVKPKPAEPLLTAERDIPEHTAATATPVSPSAENSPEERPAIGASLFGDREELKRAVIYAEILRRRF